MNRLYKKLFVILGIALLFSVIPQPAHAGGGVQYAQINVPSSVPADKLFNWNIAITPPDSSFKGNVTFNFNFRTYGNTEWNINNHKPLAPKGTVITKNCSKISTICDYAWKGKLELNGSTKVLALTTLVMKNGAGNYFFADGNLEMNYGIGLIKRYVSANLLVK